MRGSQILSLQRMCPNLGEKLMSGHIYRINFLQWNTKGSKKGKKDKKGKISGFFCPFCLFCIFCFHLTIHSDQQNKGRRPPSGVAILAR